MKPLHFGEYRLEYEPEDKFKILLYRCGNIDGDDELVDCWEDDPYGARMDIDYSPVGEEITLKEWQAVWDWIEDVGNLTHR